MASRSICLVCILTIHSFVASTGFSLTIDDFSSGSLNATLNASSSALHQVQTSLPSNSVIGGSRSNYVELNFPVTAQESAVVAIDTTAGTYRLTTAGDLEAYRLSYGLFSLSQGTPDQALNANFSGSTGIAIGVKSSAKSSLTYIQLRSGINEGTFQSAGVFVSLPASTAPYVASVPFTRYGSVNISDIDYISIGDGTIAAGLDLTLDRIYTYPPTPAGDFDGDYDVDGRDFLVWQRGGSQNSRSTIDLASWAGSYGAGSLVATTTIVPEPSSFCLCIGFVLLGSRRLC